MEAAPEGGIEVASAPHGAGRRGRVASHDWDAITAFVRARPWRWFAYHDIPTGIVDRLREQHPAFDFVGHNMHMKHPLKGDPQRVCDVYVRWTG